MKHEEGIGHLLWEKKSAKIAFLAHVGVIGKIQSFGKIVKPLYCSLRCSHFVCIPFQPMLGFLLLTLRTRTMVMQIQEGQAVCVSDFSDKWLCMIESYCAQCAEHD